MSAIGVPLKYGHISVDPKIIRYGTKVILEGVGEFTAVDTGGAVVSRKAARRIGKTPDEKDAIVIDVYFPSKASGLSWKKQQPRFIKVTWYEKDRTVLSRN